MKRNALLNRQEGINDHQTCLVLRVSAKTSAPTITVINERHPITENPYMYHFSFLFEATCILRPDIKEDFMDINSVGVDIKVTRAPSQVCAHNEIMICAPQRRNLRDTRASTSHVSL